MKLAKLTLCSLLGASAAYAQLDPEGVNTFRERIALDDDAAINAAFDPSIDSGWLGKTTFGSYGELHYNTGDVDDLFDIHRLVLFVEQEFTSNFRFVTEIEVEHLYRNIDNNEVQYELEQGYFELDLPNDFTLQAGAFLMPVGVTNEIHEPTTFYGVERNRIETEIIPSTWTEFGLLLRKNYDNGLQWDLAIHRGLKLDDGAFFNGAGNELGPDIRSGRQKAGSFDNLFEAATARIRYTGVEGLEVGASVTYQSDISEASSDDSAILSSAHFIYDTGGFALRGMVANWSFDFDSPTTGESIDNQYGYFIEPSYKWTFDNGMAVGVFGRALYFENEDRPEGQTEYQVGVNFWPTEHTVIKFDYAKEDQHNSANGDRDVYNFGVGYAF